MTTTNAAALIRDQLEAFNARDDAAFAATVSEDVVYCDYGSGLTMTGRQAFVEATTAWRASMSDVRASITNVVGEGEDAAIEVCWTGTHDGALPTPGGELPASGRPVRIETAMIVEARGGVITRMNYYFNMLSVLQQLGALPGQG